MARKYILKTIHSDYEVVVEKIDTDCYHAFYLGKCKEVTKDPLLAKLFSREKATNHCIPGEFIELHGSDKVMLQFTTVEGTNFYLTE